MQINWNMSSSHSPVPHFDGLSRGGEDGYVIWAEGQRSDICTMTAQCEARGFSASRILLCSLQGVCLHCVILQQKSKLHLSVRNQKAVHWSVDEKTLPSILNTSNAHKRTMLACRSTLWPDLGWCLYVCQLLDLITQLPLHYRFRSILFSFLSPA